MISGLVLKYLKGERLVVVGGHESALPGSSQVPLTRPIGYFIHLPGKAVVVVSLMRAEKAFTAKEIRELKQRWLVVKAACEKHGHDLEAAFAPSDGKKGNSIHKSLEVAFQTFGKGVLTPREREVVEFTLKGHSAEAIGRILEISPGTVRIRRRNVYAKLQIGSQGELFSGFINTLLEDPAVMFGEGPHGLPSEGRKLCGPSRPRARILRPGLFSGGKGSVRREQL